MKKLILFASVFSFSVASFAQSLSKEENRIFRQNESEITSALKAAEKISKLVTNADGSLFVSQSPDFEEARQLVSAAFANPSAASKWAEINYTAGQIEYNDYLLSLAKAKHSGLELPESELAKCGKGFEYLMTAWNAFSDKSYENEPFYVRIVNSLFKKGSSKKQLEAIALNAGALYSGSNGLTNCGFMYSSERDWDNAAKYFQLAADCAGSKMLRYASTLNPSLSEVVTNYAVDSVKFQNVLYAGSCLSNIDKTKSLEVFKSLIGKNISQRQVYSSIVAEYAALQDTTEMIGWLQKGMKSMPDEDYFSNNLYLIYLDRGDMNGAIQILKDASAQSPDNVSILNKIGDLYSQKEDYRSAKEIYQQVLALDDTDLYANLYLARISLAELETEERRMERIMTPDEKIDEYVNQKIDYVLPLLRKAFAADKNHDNNEVCTLLTQTLYRKYTPESCPEDLKNTLQDEYIAVKTAYER